MTVYRQNKVLAEQRLANVAKLYEEDMVTRNELIRAELQIKNIEQSILTLQNNHHILSNRLSYALNLPNNALIIPTEEIQSNAINNPAYYTELASVHHPSMLSLEKNISISEKHVAIVKSDYMPTISAFGGYNMQRPITSSTPVQDLYNNTWQAGLSLTYNIDNLIKTKQKVKLANIQTSVLQENRTYNLQHIEMDVHSSYVKYMESLQQSELMRESQRLANENYRIIEDKYLNQLAITAEMTDAATAKLDSELQLSNAEINVLFQYYSLLKSTGTL
jgi:Outer membrane protein